MNYTENYQRPQWEKTDRIVMEDFNTAFRTVEEQMLECTRIAVGSYTGNNAASWFINLGLTPAAVFVCTQEGYTRNNTSYLGGLAVSGHPMTVTVGYNSPQTILEVTDGGFNVYSDEGETHPSVFIATNRDPQVFHYIAFFA